MNWKRKDTIGGSSVKEKMTEQRFTKVWNGYELNAMIIRLDYGIQVVLTGGEKSHVGSVTVSDEEGCLHTVTIPGHKETILSEQWASNLGKAFGVPVVVTVGIHYEKLSQEGIQQILSVCNELFRDCLQWLLKFYSMNGSIEIKF